MDLTKDIAQVKDLVTKSKDILIVIHENPNMDSVGAALATYLGLAGLGKKVTIACPDPMTVEFSRFIGVNKFTKELGKKNFVISLDYVDGSIERVSYNIEGDKFNLVIEPRPGFVPFSQEKVRFTHQGTTADLIIAIDTIHLGGLKKLYEDEKELFSSHPIINIDRHPNNSHFGHINIVNPSAATTTEIVARVLSGVGVQLTVDLAANLLNALYGATDNFMAPTITSDVFEIAGICVRAGAKRFTMIPPTEEKPASGESAGGGSMSPTNILPKTPIMSVATANPGVMQNPTAQVQMPPQTIQKPVNQFAHPASQQVQEPHVQTSSSPQGKTPQTGQAPEDWLKPKIFRSSNNN